MSKPALDQELSTDRLMLKALSADDTEFIYALVNTDGWLKFIGDRNVHLPEDAKAYVQKILANAAVRYWTVSLKNSLRSIGIVTYIKRDYLDYPDLGFAFLPQFCGKGYAFEAANAILHVVLSNEGQKTVLATTLPDNNSSIRLLTKLGFRFQNELMVGNEMVHVFCVSNESVSVMDQTMDKPAAK